MSISLALKQNRHFIQLEKINGGVDLSIGLRKQ